MQSSQKTKTRWVYAVKILHICGRLFSFYAFKRKRPTTVPTGAEGRKGASKGADHIYYILTKILFNFRTQV